MSKKEELKKAFDEKFASIAAVSLSKVMTTVQAEEVFLSDTSVPVRVRVWLANGVRKKLPDFGYKMTGRVRTPFGRMRFWWLCSAFKNEDEAVSWYLSESGATTLSDTHPMRRAIIELGSPNAVSSDRVFDAISKLVPRHNAKVLGLKVKRYMQLLGYTLSSKIYTISKKRVRIYFKLSEISERQAELLVRHGSIITDFSAGSRGQFRVK